MRCPPEKTHDCVPISRVAVLVICKSCFMSPSNILSSTCLEPHERHGKNQNEIYAKTDAVLKLKRKDGPLISV